MVKIENLHAWYGESHILHGVDLKINRGELVTILGRNGAGKTTTMRAIMGFLRRSLGEIVFNGQNISKLETHLIPRLGIAYCPEERAIFKTLNVKENLILPPVIASGGMSIDEIYALFPNLKERTATPAGNLSGGEQQMLAIARILRTGAKLLLMDEPTEGLAPVIIQQIGVAINILKQRGFTILLVEQNFRFASKLSDRLYVMEHGKIIDEFSGDMAMANPEQLHEYLGV